MDTLKELLIDAVIVLFGALVIMGGSVKTHAKGLTCGQEVAATEQKAP